MFTDPTGRTSFWDWMLVMAFPALGLGDSHEGARYGAIVGGLAGGAGVLLFGGMAKASYPGCVNYLSAIKIGNIAGL